MAMWPRFILFNLNFTSVMSQYHWGFQSVVEKNRAVMCENTFISVNCIHYKHPSLSRTANENE